MPKERMTSALMMRRVSVGIWTRRGKRTTNTCTAIMGVMEVRMWTIMDRRSMVRRLSALPCLDKAANFKSRPVPRR